MATLNHPNILEIHDIGAHEGACFPVSELFAGQTREKVEPGPLPVGRTIGPARHRAGGAGRAFESGLEIRVRLRAIRRISRWL
jgi:hypothetical protein